MDPISQGALGAAATLSIWGNDKRLSPRVVGWLGALSGMAPDLDVLIRSDSDPLLAIEYHRHFTHSLAFVPVGAAVALLPWLFHSKVRNHWKLGWFIAIVGYLTHAPLDCCTTYGTQYFWPFSDYRVSLSWVSVVDPVFTIPLLVLVVAAARKKRPEFARVGLAICLSYLGLGAVQKARTMAVQKELIARRDHEPERRDVFTTFMNQVTWRSLYEADGRIYIDQIRVPYWGTTCVTEGASVPVPAGPPPDAGPRVKQGYQLMSWFSSGWVAHVQEDPPLLGDLRYSLHPYGTEPFWAIRPDVSQDEVDWVNTRAERKVDATAVTGLILEVPPGSDCSF